jgi:hypothetical protein
MRLKCRLFLEILVTWREIYISSIRFLDTDVFELFECDVGHYCRLFTVPV